MQWNNNLPKSVLNIKLFCLPGCSPSLQEDEEPNHHQLGHPAAHLPSSVHTPHSWVTLLPISCVTLVPTSPALYILLTAGSPCCPSVVSPLCQPSQPCTYSSPSNPHQELSILTLTIYVFTVMPLSCIVFQLYYIQAAQSKLYCQNFTVTAVQPELHYHSSTASPALLSQLYCQSFTMPALVPKLHCHSRTTRSSQLSCQSFTMPAVLPDFHCHSCTSRSSELYCQSCAV